jgi:hypothetical protein
MNKNLATASEFTKKLSQAKDFSEFWRIQPDLIGSQWKAFAEQTKELGQTVTKGPEGERTDS